MGLIQAVIKINNLYYAGESQESYESNVKSAGWYDYKNNNINRLKFTEKKDEAYIVEGNRNLKSIIDKVFQRVQDQEIQFNTIEIIKL